MSKIERGVLQPTLEQIMEISSNFDVTTNFLLKGIDKTHKQSNDNTVNEPREVYKATPIIEINLESTANSLVADVKASAGFGSLIESKSRLENLPAISLLNAPFGLNVAFQIEGDSMHNTYAILTMLRVITLQISTTSKTAMCIS